MTKISDSFLYDVSKFVIESRRNALLTQFLGDPDGFVPGQSVQGLFERTQALIGRLPELSDPNSDVAELRLLAWIVGWDDAQEVSFIDDLDDAGLRKLISLSVPLWKKKGTAEGIVDAIRVFTGKTALVQDWFFHRWILDEAGFWVESRGSDPWLVGGLYTEADEALTWVIINREGLTGVEQRYVYDLLTYTRVTGQHYGIIYAAFADDFADGFAQWEQVGVADTLVTTADAYKGGMLEGASIKALVAATETVTWSPTLRVVVHVEFATSGVDEAITVEVMRDGAEAEFYAVELRADGQFTLTRRGTVPASWVQVALLPLPGYPVGVELRVEALNAGETKVTALVSGELYHEQTFVGDDAYIDSVGGLVVTRSGSSTETTFIDNVVVTATPFDVQFIGQQALTPIAGFGGVSYVADPDPGVESFTGTGA